MTGIYDPHGMGWMLFAVLAVAAQLDRDYIREKTLEGQAAAAAKGNHGGRPRVIDEDMLVFARALHEQGTRCRTSPPNSPSAPARTPAPTPQWPPSTARWPPTSTRCRDRYTGRAPGGSRSWRCYATPSPSSSHPDRHPRPAVDRRPRAAAAAPESTATPIRIGYARTGTATQELASQLDALARAGCTRVFSEQISTRVKVRPELERALALVTEIKTAAPGQPVILTVHEMKRLARNAAELMALSAALQEREVALELLTGFGPVWSRWCRPGRRKGALLGRFHINSYRRRVRQTIRRMGGATFGSPLEEGPGLASWRGAVVLDRRSHK